ncbi:hypothetical protein MJO28_011421 [Puccinia striiformis f. sp. tritici]|uniref:Uncharacterized protein n=1 Tax=Puccinia striiformis f. sp. tritici TaxID=168172 RepID=A0ACC0E416_9BASI|nr:hypothetical protein MJO28_011421 [Puccinia striiformis f. sp. tritici]
MAGGRVTLRMTLLDTSATEGIQTERIPFDLNKLPQEELATDTLCSDNLIAPCLVAQKSVDPNKELDEEDVAEILLSLQQTKPPSPVVEQLNSSSGLNRGGSGLWLSAKDVTPGGSSSVAGGHPQDSFLTNSCLSSSSRKRKKATLTSNKSPKSTLIKGRNHWIFATEENLLRENHSRGEDQFSSQYQRMNAYPKPQTADIVNKEIENLDVVKLNNDQKTDEVFNVYNWDFIRADVGGRTPDKHQAELFQFLNGYKDEPDLEHPFFLERDQKTSKFLSKFFVDSRRDLKVLEVIKPDCRQRQLFKTCLKISNSKINLDGYSAFKVLIGGMKDRLEANYKNRGDLATRINIKTALKYVMNVTKVTHLLIIIYLSLFKEHESEILKVQQVENTLMSLTQMWWDLEEGIKPEILKLGWTEDVTKILNFQEGKSWLYYKATSTAALYSIASNLLDYWVVQTGKPLFRSTSKPRLAKSTKRPAKNHQGIIALINKIIFYSNYQMILGDIKNSDPGLKPDFN